MIKKIIIGTVLCFSLVGMVVAADTPTKEDLTLQLRATWGDYYLAQKNSEIVLKKLQEKIEALQKQIKAMPDPTKDCPSGDCPENAD